jgi:hypothetical protein
MATPRRRPFLAGCLLIPYANQRTCFFLFFFSATARALRAPPPPCEAGPRPAGGLCIHFASWLPIDVVRQSANGIFLAQLRVRSGRRRRLARPGPAPPGTWVSYLLISCANQPTAFFFLACNCEGASGASPPPSEAAPRPAGGPGGTARPTPRALDMQQLASLPAGQKATGSATTARWGLALSAVLAVAAQKQLRKRNSTCSSCSRARSPPGLEHLRLAFLLRPPPPRPPFDIYRQAPPAASRHACQRQRQRQLPTCRCVGQWLLATRCWLRPTSARGLQGV